MCKSMLSVAFLFISILAYGFDSGVPVEVDTTKSFAANVEVNTAYRETWQLCRNLAIKKGMPADIKYEDHIMKLFQSPDKDFDRQKAEFVFASTAAAGYFVSEEIVKHNTFVPKQFKGYMYKMKYHARIISPQNIKPSSLGLKVSVSKKLLKPGEAAELTLTPEQDGFLYGFVITPDDKLQMIIPRQNDSDRLTKKGVAVKQSFVAEDDINSKGGIATLYVVFSTTQIFGFYKFYPKPDDSIDFISLGSSSFGMLKSWLPTYNPATRADTFVQLNVKP